VFADELLDPLYFFWRYAPVLHSFAPRDDAPEDGVCKGELFAWTQVAKDFERSIKGQIAQNYL
jgi:hypothetical protein